ncbi:Holliday junction resolvasome RuvABC endonuclease subunit [Haloechinothrix alba]|uniref:Holliday junction resolvasome RuvABC endonuclease subunit n=1 Tax=Haloechinothrix alba TaxID=664784 RepID=A0A238WE00_9PSEU|nr:crossover junction endodeoxyribonuclease RuvC [Haloechinothrix alba]SNR44503.1 Holliday junction resolvasome RuvABC endonuclease subunit [Haloechinothrix alba]
MRVVGIDPSLTSTGLAWLEEDWPEPRTTTVRSSGSRDHGLELRARRIGDLASEVLRTAADAALVVVEAPSFGSAGGSSWDRAGLWWRIVGCLTSADTPVAQVAPRTRARWASGTGKADKAAVSAGVARLWPGVDITTSDEADALALATMGAQHLGWDVPTLARHHDPLQVVRWPATLCATYPTGA